MFYFGSVFYHCESLSFHLVLLDKVNHLRKTPLTFLWFLWYSWDQITTQCLTCCMISLCLDFLYCRKDLGSLMRHEAIIFCQPIYLQGPKTHWIIFSEKCSESQYMLTPNSRAGSEIQWSLVRVVQHTETPMTIICSISPDRSP